MFFEKWCRMPKCSLHIVLAGLCIVTVPAVSQAQYGPLGELAPAEIQWEPPAETLQGQPHVLYLSAARPVNETLNNGILALEGDGALVVRVTDAKLFDYILSCWRCDNVIVADVPYAADPSESEALTAYIAHGGLAVVCQTLDPEDEEQIAVQVYKDGAATLGDKALPGPMLATRPLLPALIRWIDCRIGCMFVTLPGTQQRIDCDDVCDRQFVQDTAT